MNLFIFSCSNAYIKDLSLGEKCLNAYGLHQTFGFVNGHHCHLGLSLRRIRGDFQEFLINRVVFPAFLCCVTFPCEHSNLVGDQLVVSHLLHIRHTILVQIFLVILFVGLNVLLCPLHQRLPTVMQYGITLSHPSDYLEDIKSTELYAALTRSAWRVPCCENLWEVANTAVML